MMETIHHEFVFKYLSSAITVVEQFVKEGYRVTLKKESDSWNTNDHYYTVIVNER